MEKVKTWKAAKRAERVRKEDKIEERGSGSLGQKEK